MTAEIARLLRALSPSFGRLRKKTGTHASATGEMPRNKADQTRLNGDANAYRSRRRVESWWDNPKKYADGVSGLSAQKNSCERPWRRSGTSPMP